MKSLATMATEFEQAFLHLEVPDLSGDGLSCLEEWGSWIPSLIVKGDEDWALNQVEFKHWSDFSIDDLPTYFDILPVRAIEYYLQSCVILPFRSGSEPVDPCSLRMADRCTLFCRFSPWTYFIEFVEDPDRTGFEMNGARMFWLCKRMNQDQRAAVVEYIRWFAENSPEEEVREACRFSLSKFWHPMIEFLIEQQESDKL
jgi:hypothetical protein